MKKKAVVERTEKKTIFFRSQEPIKAVCLHYQALCGEEGGVVDFHRGGLSGMDGERSGWRADQEMEGGGGGGVS